MSSRYTDEQKERIRALEDEQERLHNWLVEAAETAGEKTQEYRTNLYALYHLIQELDHLLEHPEL